MANRQVTEKIYLTPEVLRRLRHFKAGADLARDVDVIDLLLRAWTKPGGEFDAGAHYAREQERLRQQTTR